MSVGLRSPSLAWAIWDREGVVAAAVRDLVHQMLATRDVRSKMLRSESPQHIEQLASAHRLGLAVWVVSTETELTGVCQTIGALRDKHLDTLCACYLAEPRIDWYALLIEAGAQVIVSDLSAFHSALPRIVARAPISSQSYHPLVAGLMERLPWGS